MLVSDVERFIKSIINEFDEQGRSFSEITLINPKLVITVSRVIYFAFKAAQY